MSAYLYKTQSYYLNKTWPMISRGDVLRCPVFGDEYVAIENSAGRYIRVTDESGRKTYVKRGELQLAKLRGKS